MNITPQEFVEGQVVTTRFFKSKSETLVSMAGVAYKTETGGTGTIFSPSDKNVSLTVSSSRTPDFEMVTYHCFAGMFASRIYRCLDKQWEIFRLHLNLYSPGERPEAHYGELLLEQQENDQIAQVYIEHFGPPVQSHRFLVEAIRNQRLAELIEPCPVKLTPRRELYAIGLQLPPHPGMILVDDAVLAPYLSTSKEPKKEYIT